MAACPTDDRIAAFVEGALSSDDAATVRAHLGGCEACAELVADYAEAFGLPSADLPHTQPPFHPTGAHAPQGPDLDLSAGEMFDRYVVLMLAGRGGMGEVYVAYDPTLDRKLALKIVRESRAPDEAAQDRLLAEARKAAAVAHENLVPIYDVGLCRGRAYIAMEYVEGPSLAHWLRAGPRTHDEIVDVFVGAARGLAAAHDAGIVHRDFKPGNVLLGRDGRPRVADFGLARAADDDEGHALVGTPAYMAPEQWSDAKVDARADQYALCVALFEALHGRRPPRADADTGVDGSDVPPRRHPLDEAGARPTPCDAVLRRGLSIRPEDRFGSMRELIAALQPRRRGRAAIWLAAAVGLVGIAAWGAWPRPRAEPTCAGQDQIDALVSAETKATIHAALEDTGVAFADDAATQTVRALDGYAAQWVAAYEQTCAGPPRPATSSCLRRTRDELSATLDILRDADPAVATRAVSMIRGLVDPAACLERARTDADPFAPDLEIAAIEAKGAQVLALRRAGRYETAHEIAQDALAAARDLGHTRTLGRAEFWIGMLQIRRAEHDAAATHLERAAWLSSRVSDEEIHLRSLAALIGLEGGLSGRPERAHRWSKRAHTALRAAGSPPRMRQSVLLAEGGYAALAGDDRRAIELLSEAVSVAEQLHGEDHHLVGRPLQGLGIARLNAGDLAGAKRDLRRAAAATEADLGPQHPELAKSLDVLAAIAHHEGELDEAVAIARRSLQIVRAAHGIDSLRTAQAHHHLGMHLDDAGDRQGAAKHLDLAIAGMKAAGGPYERSLQKAYDALGLLRYHTQQYEAAITAFERSIEVAKENGEQIEVATSWSHLGDALRLAGRVDEAERAHLTALRIREDHGRPHYVAASLAALARVAKAREDWPRARALYEDAVGHWEADYGPDHPYTNNVRDALAEIEKK